MERIERPTPRHGFLWPLMLIGLGVLLLLFNIGALSWNAWDALARLWPLLLIGGGLEILIGRRSTVASFAVALITIVAIIAATWLLSTGTQRGAGYTTETVSQPLGNATKAQITIGMGVGELRIGAAQDSTDLVQGRIDLRPGERLTRTFNVVGDTASMTLRTEQQRTSIWPGPRRDDRGVWDLRLRPDVPMALTIDTGVSKSTVDLQAVRVTSLQVNTGVGQTELSLPRAGAYTATVDGGVGAVVVTIPEGVAARITVGSHLGGLNIPSTYTKAGDTYTSPDYETATNRATVVISSGVGSITIR